jgi:hypothetical protein
MVLVIVIRGPAKSMLQYPGMSAYTPPLCSHGLANGLARGSVQARDPAEELDGPEQRD